jgi:ribosome-binding factor A
MRKDSNRPRRIAELIQRELVAVIERELHDPRVTRLTITAVDVAPDLTHAKVYITQLGGAARSAGTLAALNHAAGFLRTALARRVVLRGMPELRFLYDSSVEQGARLTSLIERALAEDRTHPKNED